MKVAFLCEGDSEFESVTLLLQKLNIYNFKYLKKWKDPIPDDGCIYVFRHNYHNVSLIEHQYLDFSEILIEESNYSKVFVWFDSNPNFPVCDYARGQYALINKKYLGKIELLISIRALENWYLSNIEVLSCMIKVNVNESYLSSRGIKNFLNDSNVDIRNAKKILIKLKIGTEIECFSKQKIATRFFHCLSLDATYRSESLSRFLQKIQYHFSQN